MKETNLKELTEEELKDVNGGVDWHQLKYQSNPSPNWNINIPSTHGSDEVVTLDSEQVNQKGSFLRPR